MHARDQHQLRQQHGNRPDRESRPGILRRFLSGDAELVHHGKDEHLRQHPRHQRQADSEDEERQHPLGMPQAAGRDFRIQLDRIRHRGAAFRQAPPDQRGHDEGDDRREQGREQDADPGGERRGDGRADNRADAEAGTQEGDLALPFGLRGAVGDIGLRGRVGC